jgi:peptidylprolyl isomerase
MSSPHPLFPEAGSVLSTTELIPGLSKSVVQAGTGVAGPPTPGTEVYAHYTGKLDDGSVFDSSRTRGKPFVFRIGIGAVINAWDVGIASMKIGERAILSCEAVHGYGAKGAGGVIPPNAKLAFDVELLSVGAPPAGQDSGFCAVA